MHLGFWRIQSATEGSRVQKEHTNCPDNEQRCGKKTKMLKRNQKGLPVLLANVFVMENMVAVTDTIVNVNLS